MTDRLPALGGSLESLVAGDDRGQLEAALAAYLPRTRWFGGKARAIRDLTVDRLAAIPVGENRAQLVLVRVRYHDGGAEEYALPLLVVASNEASEAACIAFVVGEDGEPLALVDASADRLFATALLEMIRAGTRIEGPAGELAATPSEVLSPLLADHPSLTPRVMGAEQSNTSIRYGDRLILKLFRRIERGVNPELEIGRFLTARGFPATPPVVGWLEFVQPDGEPLTLGILQQLVPNEGDGWTFTLAALDRFLTRQAGQGAPTEHPSGSLVAAARHPIPAEVAARIGDYLDAARLLGRRTAELHLALASDLSDPAFAPAPFSTEDQRAFASGLRDRWSRLRALFEHPPRPLPAGTQADARAVVAAGPLVEARLAAAERHSTTAAVIRCHGDYHLGQVLVHDGDFIIIDFEGEPSRTIEERRQKRSPLRDVAGMLRSFHYAAASAGPSAKEWADYWYHWASAAYLAAYLEAAQDAPFLPQTDAEIAELVELLLLEKALYEAEYELNSRPDWVGIPLAGIRQILGV